MRTTLDIDAKILEEALQSTGASSKKKAVEIALREYIRFKRRQDLISRIGKWKDFDLTLEDLEKLRNESV
jgi:Arc/MetJ family transcription regulator